MENIENLTKKLFEKYGIAMSKDDPAWLIWQVHTDLIKNLLDAIENVAKIVETLKKESNCINDNLQKLDNIQTNLDISINEHRKTQEILEKLLSDTVTEFNQKLKIAVEKLLSDTVTEFNQKLKIAIENIETKSITNKIAKSLISKFEDIEVDIIKYVAGISFGAGVFISLITATITFYLINLIKH